MYNANASGAYWEEQREIAEAIEGNAIEGATYNPVMESVLRLGRDHEATMTRKAVESRLAEEDAPRGGRSEAHHCCAEGASAAPDDHQPVQVGRGR
jgi:hypothetical protein